MTPATFVRMRAMTRHLRVWLGAVLGWSIVGALVLTFLDDGPQATADPHDWAGLLVPTVVYVALWAVLTPPLLALSGLLEFRRPGAHGRNMSTAGLLATLAGTIAFAHTIGYAAIITTVTDAGGLANLSDGALFFVGRFREDIAIASLLVVAQHLLRERDRVRERELDAARLAASLSESRLQALSMELQPHFLFNTLNAIAGMVWQDPAKADAMVVQLSELLRRTLEAGAAPTSTMAEERHVLGLYLAIQQVRFGPRLTVTVDIPEALDGAVVPRFLLQPIVENAFQHGLTPKPGAVTLTVRVTKGEERLLVAVLDDGVGFKPGTVLVESTGVGNMRSRLAALYGTRGSLALSPRQGGGAEVHISFPLSFRSASSHPTVTGTEFAIPVTAEAKHENAHPYR